MQVIGGQLTSVTQMEALKDDFAPGMLINGNGHLSLLTNDDNAYVHNQRVPVLADLLVLQIWKKQSIAAQPATMT